MKIKNESGKYKATHGMTKTRFYRIWGGMKERCYRQKHPMYYNYGGRGITVCDEWKNDFINFKNDMYESYKDHVEQYGEFNTTIDRIDSDKGYFKENCKWSTRKEQQNNIRVNVRFEIDDVIYNPKEASRVFGIPEQTIRSRISSGKTGSDIIKPIIDLSLEEQSGIKGVIYNKRSNKWHVKGLKNGKSDTYIKSFDDVNDAIVFKAKWDNGEITDDDLGIRANNTSGIVGIRETKNGKYQATISINKIKHIKTFNTLEDAVKWRNKLKNCNGNLELIK